MATRTNRYARAGLVAVGVLAFVLTTVAAGEGLQAKSGDKCFVSVDAVACIVSGRPRELRILERGDTKPFTVRLDTPVRYVHIASKAAIYLVAEDGRVGLTPWPRPENMAQNIALRFRVTREFRGMRLGRIISWTRWRNRQYALDEGGQILVTSGPMPGARLIKIPRFPKGTTATISADDQNQYGVETVIVGAIANGKPFYFSKALE